MAGIEGGSLGTRQVTIKEPYYSLSRPGSKTGWSRPHHGIQQALIEPTFRIPYDISTAAYSEPFGRPKPCGRPQMLPHN